MEKPHLVGFVLVQLSHGTLVQRATAQERPDEQGGRDGEFIESIRASHLICRKAHPSFRAAYFRDPGPVCELCPPSTFDATDRIRRSFMTATIDRFV
jgi:hypothetical protein